MASGRHVFFTVNCLRRNNNTLLVDHIHLLREVVAKVKQAYPFRIHAWVLPEHMHCVIELPQGDADFAIRWMLIKMLFSRALPKNERLSATRLKDGSEVSGSVVIGSI